MGIFDISPKVYICLAVINRLEQSNFDTWGLCVRQHTIDGIHRNMPYLHVTNETSSVALEAN